MLGQIQALERVHGLNAQHGTFPDYDEWKEGMIMVDLVASVCSSVEEMCERFTRRLGAVPPALDQFLILSQNKGLDDPEQFERFRAAARRQVEYLVRYGGKMELGL